MLLLRWHDMTLYRWTVDIILYIKGCWKNDEPSQCSKQHLPFTSLIPQKAANGSNSVQPHAVHTDLALSWSKSLLFPSGKSWISTTEIVVLSLLKFRLISTENWNFSEYPLVGRESHRNGLLGSLADILFPHSCPMTHKFHSCSHLAANIMVCFHFGYNPHSSWHHQPLNVVCFPKSTYEAQLSFSFCKTCFWGIWVCFQKQGESDWRKLFK